MALTNVTADAIATAFCTANGITDATAINKWKSFCEFLYSHLKTDLSVAVTIGTSTIVSAVAGASATGPAAPVLPTVVIS